MVKEEVMKKSFRTGVFGPATTGTGSITVRSGPIALSTRRIQMRLAADIFYVGQSMPAVSTCPVRDGAEQ